MSFGLVSGFLLRKLFLGIGELDVQFQCRLLRLVQALIFGVLVGFLEPFFVPFPYCLVGFVGLYLALLVLIIVGFVILVGEKCGHGLTSRPRESASKLLLNELLSLFRYPSRSGRALLNGTLPLRYCVVRFAHSTPTWRLPVSGQVGRLVAAYPDSSGDCSDEVFALGVPLVCKSSPVRKRFRLNRKNPCTPCGDIGSFSSTCMEEVAFFWGFVSFRC